ncbi:MAG: DUF2029 domain-containing protein, partial [Chloroflexi bacterium]|nr:DUF2029 domain-containing protein [Chloroflexota bacterium]
MERGHVAALRQLAPWLLAALGVAILVGATLLFIGSTGFGYDFQAYDAAARRLAAGGPLYPPGTVEAYNAGAYSGLYLYPPPLAVLLVPLTALPVETATVAWLVGRLALLAIGCALLPVRREVRLALWFVASISFPVLYDLNLGNLSVVLFFLGAVAWRWNGSPLAGAAIALAVAVRYPFGLVGIAWILTRRTRSIAGAVITGGALFALTLPIVGIDGWLDYVTILRGLEDVSTGPHNFTLGSALEMLGIGAPWPTVAMLAGLAGAVAAVAEAGRRRDPELAVVVALAGTVLFAPFFHPHYLVALLIPAAYVANRGHWWGLLLPLLGWLPGELLGLAAVVGVVAPL